MIFEVVVQLEMIDAFFVSFHILVWEFLSGFSPTKTPTILALLK